MAINLGAVSAVRKRFEAEPVEKRFPVSVRQDRSAAHFFPEEHKAPYVTTGPICKDSQGYSIARVTKAYSRLGLDYDWPDAKYERHIHDQLISLGYPHEGGVLVPFCSKELEAMHPQLKSEGLVEALAKSVQGFDSEDMRQMYKRYQIAKALGEDIDTGAGFLVRPERAVEIIDILRDKSLLGRTTIREQVLPKSGRLEVNKTTTDVAWTYTSENTDITTLGLTDPALGQVNLIAKTAVGIAKLSNQLIADSTPSAEMWVRDLYGASMVEHVNQTLITGSGMNGNPRGILNTPGITVRIAGTVGINGDTLKPEDVASAVTDVQEVNGTFEGWIFRPVMTGVIRNRRADAAVAADKAGLFLFVEGLGANPSQLQGYPIWESTKVTNTRTKGTASNLTIIIGGMLSQVWYGRMATLELQSSQQAGTAFQANQTWIRAVRRDDVQIGIPATVVVIDTLLQS